MTKRIIKKSYPIKFQKFRYRNTKTGNSEIKN